LANNAEKSGVKVTLEIWKGMWHAFQEGFAVIVPEAKKAVNNIGQFIKKF
jgi:acetyl esterase/lipase